MAYWDVSQLAQDNDFIMRTRACVSTEGEADPIMWTQTNMWAMAAAPGFGDKYGYAVQIGTPNPGRDQSVISDPEILSAAQTIMAGTMPSTAGLA